MDICEEEPTFNISELKEYIDKEFESTNQESQKNSQSSNLKLNINPVKSKSARKNVAWVYIWSRVNSWKIFDLYFF